MGKDGVLVCLPSEGIDDAASQRCDPYRPPRIEMRRNLCCLTFGELVLKGEDLSEPLVSPS